MTYQHDDSEPTVSLEIQLLVDRLCDSADERLRSQQQVDWNELFAELERVYWPYFLKSLIPQVKQTLGLEQQQQVLAIFADCSSEIVDLISDYSKRTVQRDSRMTSLAEERKEAVEELEPLPAMIDHFEIIKQIGRGGFGRVLLANDRHLNREVVIKIPREKYFTSETYLGSFVEEARKVALLDHPGIVRIHHVGIWESRPYLVQQYVPGGDLKQVIRSRRFTFEETAELIADVAESIAYAHRHRIVHRDLKPANILLNENDKPLVADFGLAIDESEQFGNNGVVAGTAQYMAPEQLRGEVHRLDGRTDLWSLGVCLYLMLTGELPFHGADSSKLRSLIANQPCRPPRQINSSIPWELERICLKCLSIRMDDRYSTGGDLASDLREWGSLQSQADGKSGAALYLKPEIAGEDLFAESVVTLISANDNRNVASDLIVSKGLHAFDRKDHQYFLTLLPGPKSRLGIPEQLRFWSDRVSANEQEETFCVGLLYGPSGCGKSSFVKAGLLPLLPHDIAAVYVEATDTDTEVRLLVALRKIFPEIPRDLDLPTILAKIRTRHWGGKQRKVLIVFDQFEQWLQVNEVTLTNQLVEALRHCDGSNLQALVLARDDFWMKISRFFQELEIPLSEKRNFQPLHLFDKNHAKHVLADFGRACGRLPTEGTLDDQQKRFLADAVDRLSDKGKIICIHLVLLADTLKDSPWLPATLRRIGDLKHIGMLFLDQQFSSEQANPSHRLLLVGICKCLEFLLPEDNENIKARFRQRAELAKASGYPEESKQFASMMEILENQLRLISPADPDLGVPTMEQENVEARYHQLSHDFLVPSVREWLRSLQRQTPVGRARTRLQSLATSYSNSGDVRFMPSFWEFIEILRYVRLNDCSDQAKELYLRASRTYAIRASAAVACVLVLIAGWRWNAITGITQIADLKIDQFVHATSAEFSLAATLIEDYPAVTIGLLREKISDPSASTAEIMRLKVGLALAGAAEDADLLQLTDYVPGRPYSELGIFRKAFQQNLGTTIPALKGKLRDPLELEQQVKVATILFHLGETETLHNALNFSANSTLSLLATHAIAEDTDDFEDYVKYVEYMKSDVEKHGLLAGMVRGLALKSMRVADKELLAEWISLCWDLFENSPNGPMHSAAEFALTKMETDSALTMIKSEPIQDDEKGWYITPAGLTMVLVQADGIEVPGESQDDGEVISTYSGERLSNFWISTKEVPVGLFRKFAAAEDEMNAFKRISEKAPDAVPITNVRLIDAMRFCNWMSEEEGLKRYYIESDQPLELHESEMKTFGSVGAGEFWKKYSRWSIRPDSDGYRLPFIGESLYVPFGLNEPRLEPTSFARRILPNYAWFSDNTDPLSLKPGGQLMPNHLGLFDVIGNAAEFVLENQFETVRLEQRMTNDSFKSTIENMTQRKHMLSVLWISDPALSFRVARSTFPVK